MNSLLPILFLLVLVGVVLFFKSRYSIEKNFDEREQIVRGQAYRYAYTAIIIFEAFHVILLLFMNRPVMADGVSSLLAIFLSIGVFACYSIAHDAFKTTRTEKSFRSYVALLIAVVLFNVFGGYTSWRDGSLMQDGILQMPVSSIACALTFFVVLVAILIKRARDGQEVDESKTCV